MIVVVSAFWREGVCLGLGGPSGDELGVCVCPDVIHGVRR
jgi:hypothetical protein